MNGLGSTEGAKKPTAQTKPGNNGQAVIRQHLSSPRATHNVLGEVLKTTGQNKGRRQVPTSVSRAQTAGLLLTRLRGTRLLTVITVVGLLSSADHAMIWNHPLAALLLPLSCFLSSFLGRFLPLLSGLLRGFFSLSHNVLLWVVVRGLLGKKRGEFAPWVLLFAKTKDSQRLSFDDLKWDRTCRQAG